jgi:hypothetical protein
MKTVSKGMKKGVVLSALFCWGSSKGDRANIESEMHHLKNIFKNDTCSTTEIQVPCTNENVHIFGIQTNCHSYHIMQ